MCEYCGEKTQEERKRLVADADYVSRQLHDLAHYYRHAARGKIVHHVDSDHRPKGAAQTALSIVRRLVNDWV